MSRDRKLNRWTDLLAALLRRRYPATLEELTSEVPAYRAAPSKAALRRAFERDKEELRSFGVPIETVDDPDGDAQGYRLRQKDFYLPYLSVAGGAHEEPKVIDRDGFRALARLAFEPDELIAIEQAARRAVALGEASLAAHARSALRKLAVDLPVGAGAADDSEYFAGAAQPVDQASFDAIDEALARRKRVSMAYHSMGTDSRDRRTVEPLGLFFLGHHWYVAARGTDDERIKTYRMSRISDVEVNRERPGTPDYDTPAGFRLREYARSRQAWELGDGDVMMAEVEFTADPAARRSFAVRRLNPFVRWLLSLGGAARPVGPSELVEAYAAAIDLTLAQYQESR